MGIRADFYVGRGPQAEWIGSIAWDGYPDGIDRAVKEAKTEVDYRAAVDGFLRRRDDATRPDQGWPWPWDNSLTTDYSYALDGGCVWATNWGYSWFDARGPHPEDEQDPRQAVFPDMTARRVLVREGKRSGVIIVAHGPSGFKVV